MDLTTRKLINNGGLPKLSTGFEIFDFFKNPRLGNTNTYTKTPDQSSTPSKIGDIAGSALQIGTSGLAFAGALSNSAQTSITADEMIRNNGTSQVDGISHDIQSVDSLNAMDRAEQERTQGTLGAMGAGAAFGGTVGSLAGPAGGIFGGAAGAVAGLFGGLFGSSSAKRKAEAARREAERRTIAHNQYGYDMALTLSLRNKEALRYGSSADLMLYAAKEGYEPINPITNETVKKHIVETADGQEYRSQNAWFNKGEVAWRLGSPYINPINHGKNDTARGYIDNNTVVFSNEKKFKDPYTGKTPAQRARQATSVGELYNIMYDQANYKQLEDMLNYKKNMYAAKNGFLPRLAKGWENLAVNGLGGIISLGDYVNHMRQDVFDPNIQPYNKYEGRVTDLMTNRRANAYSALQNMFENEAGERFRINNSSGLSAAQRTLANIANSSNTRLGRANMLLNVQNMNNEYAKDTANMLNQMGTTGMNAKLQADQFNSQVLASSQAKKHDLMMNDKYNMLNYATQFAKNNWERTQFDKMYELYVQQVANDRLKAYKELFNSDGTFKTTNKTMYPVYGSDDWWNTMRRAAEKSKMGGWT